MRALGPWCCALERLHAAVALAQHKASHHGLSLVLGMPSSLARSNSQKSSMDVAQHVVYEITGGAYGLSLCACSPVNHLLPPGPAEVLAECEKLGTAVVFLDELDSSMSTR